jgi:hypothetical protein
VAGKEIAVKKYVVRLAGQCVVILSLLTCEILAEAADRRGEIELAPRRTIGFIVAAGNKSPRTFGASCASPFGPAILVTHDPERTSSRQLISQTGTVSSTMTSALVGIVLTSLKRACSSRVAYCSFVRVRPPRSTRNTKSMA